MKTSVCIHVCKCEVTSYINEINYSDKNTSITAV